MKLPILAPAAAVALFGQGAYAQTSVIEVRAGYEIVASDTLLADDVTGATVYGPNEEEIGGIRNLLLDPKGVIEAAVVDVGGHLGIGERQVAIPMDQLSIHRVCGGDEVRARSVVTAEDLEEMPEFR